MQFVATGCIMLRLHERTLSVDIVYAVIDGRRLNTIGRCMYACRRH